MTLDKAFTRSEDYRCSGYVADGSQGRPGDGAPIQEVMCAARSHQAFDPLPLALLFIEGCRNRQNPFHTRSYFCKSQVISDNPLPLPIPPKQDSSTPDADQTGYDNLHTKE
ncbi:hypothetical protein SUGI_0508130 [Cryptomeria japonica]|nr:hypothetical protein SUGI_0508130 [Cryptomeria japonica]